MASVTVARRRAVARTVKARWKRARIERMLAQIATGRERDAAIAEARALGSRLQEIGTAIGLTRQRVHQICQYGARKDPIDAVRKRPVGQPARTPEEGQ